MIYYFCINIGSLASIATTELELHVGFSAAFLLPILLFLVGFAVLVGGRKKYVVRAPKQSVIVHAFQAMWIGLRSWGNMDAARPSHSREDGRRRRTPWDDVFIDDIQRALVACSVFLFYPIYCLVYGQMVNNFVSQGTWAFEEALTRHRSR